MRRLPDYDAVRAQRERMNQAARAHAVLHALYAAREQLAGWIPGEPPPGEPALADARAWPQVARALAELPNDAAQAERLSVALAALEPEGSHQHDEEHALEHLLYDQFQRLQADPELADVRAYLDPLYAEREALYNTLLPLAEEHGFVEAAVALVERMEGIARGAWQASVAAGHTQTALAVALETADSVCEALSDTLPKLRLTAAVPMPDPSLAPVERMANLSERLAAYLAEQRAAEQAMGAEVERQHDRWRGIEALLHEVTG